MKNKFNTISKILNNQKHQKILIIFKKRKNKTLIKEIKTNKIYTFVLIIFISILLILVLLILVVTKTIMIT